MPPATKAPKAVPDEIALMIKERDALVGDYNSENDTAQSAVALGDEAAAKSANAKKSNRSREIRELEFKIASEMAENGLSLEAAGFAPWEPPRSKKTRSSKPSMTKDELQSALDKAYRVATGDGFPKSTQKTADQRITQLLKDAERFKYEVSDPRV